jgi:glycosyltransferase involved in cell wall biosynthesis
LSRNIDYLFVGSHPPNQPYLLDTLKKNIEASPAKNNIKLCPFTNDIWTIWDACDIAVIPSIEPEPFGMVALEAMAAKKPIIAASHGGVKEIVVDKVTGLLIKPGDSTDLAKKISTLTNNHSFRKTLGENGYVRLTEMFNLDSFIKKISKQCCNTITIH